MYSFVAVGAVTIFAWDLLFPDLLDVFVVVTTSHRRPTLVSGQNGGCLPLSRIIFGRHQCAWIHILSVAIGAARTGAPLVAHLLAVLASGTFAAAFFLGLQGAWWRFSANVSSAHLTFPAGHLHDDAVDHPIAFSSVSQFLKELMNTSAARYFPPFWFLGIYEYLLGGSSSLPVFTGLAKTGCLATAAVLGLSIVSYPLAYRRRMRYLVEGSSVFDTGIWPPCRSIVCSTATLLRNCGTARNLSLHQLLFAADAAASCVPGNIWRPRHGSVGCLRSADETLA